MNPNKPIIPKQASIENIGPVFALSQLWNFLTNFKPSFNDKSKRQNILSGLNVISLEKLYKQANKQRELTLARYIKEQNGLCYYAQDSFCLLTKAVDYREDYSNKEIAELRNIKNDFRTKTKEEQLKLLGFFLKTDEVKYSYMPAQLGGYDNSEITIYTQISGDEYNEKVDFLKPVIDSKPRLLEIMEKYPKLIPMQYLQMLKKYQPQILI